MTDKMLPADVDPDLLDFEDPEVRRLIEVLDNEQKYNSELTNFLDMSYPWQRQAMNLTKDHHVVGLICGNQMGKSETACALIAMHATGVYPTWYRGRRFKEPPLILVSGVDSNFNKNVLQDKLFGTNNVRGKTNNKDLGTGKIPRPSINIGSIVSQRGEGIDNVKIKHSSGKESTILFKGYEGGREAVQGVPADVVYIDEQPKDDFWSEVLVRTAATQGSVICAFTPLKGMTGLVETLSELPPAKDADEDKFGAKLKTDGDWAMVRASWDDITHIDDKQKNSLRKGFQAYELDARVYGMPIAGHGRIFPYQEGEISYDPREVQIDTAWPHLIGLDIGHGHGGDPTVAICAVWDEANDTIYITEENEKDTPTVRDIAKTVWGISPDIPVAWPNDANRRSANSPGSVVDGLNDLNVNCLGKAFMNPKDAAGKKNNFIRPGITEINERFHDGRLRISTNCNILLKQIEQYQYKENGDIPVDGKIDAIDAFRYAVMSIIQGFGQPAFQNPWNNEDDWDDEPVLVRSGVRLN